MIKNLKEKAFNQVLIAVITTIASTLIVNTINDARDVVKIRIDSINEKIEKLESTTINNNSNLSRVYQKIAEIRNDIRSIESTERFNKIEATQSIEFMNEKLSKIEKQLDDVKKKIRML